MKTIKDIEQPSESRGAKYNILKAFEAFEIANSDDMNGTSGNIKDIFQEYVWNCDDPAHYKTSYGAKNQKSFLDLVSAPMLLARLVAAGMIPTIEGQQGYKVTWTIALRHKETKEILTFYDYKGASSYGSSNVDNKAFTNDVLKVLKALINPKFPHPYDGCVVGEIA